MKSSSGRWFVGLDQVRGLAAFLVFCWHFMHYTHGAPVPFSGEAALGPLALLDEGHTGVALFMALSGYLFAKLLDGREVAWGPFLWNRCLRLLPMLGLVVVVEGVSRFAAGKSISAYVIHVAAGVLLPKLPNGGWSVTVEAHFYVLLPILLAMWRRSAGLLIGALLLALAVRYVLFLSGFEIKWWSYFTIVGRVDQFLLGILAWHFRSILLGRRGDALFALVGALFLLFYSWFDRAGGMNGGVPEHIWIVLPTIEGLAYSVAIAWYDPRASSSPGLFGRLAARYGEYSYSTYLTHLYYVAPLAEFVHLNVMDISTVGRALPWALLCYCLTGVPGFIFWRFLESPFLKLRKPYFRTRPEPRALQ